MKTTKIKIRNLFGITEQTIIGNSVEITGDNGTGKTSVIDAIRYALTNASDRDYIIKNGESEGEIIIETDTGLSINRRKRTTQADYKSVKENGREILGPESFLRSIFSPLQLDPVEFTQMSKKEQNRAILDLIDFKWDLNWIKEQFGEIPDGVNYDQNILQVLNDIQAENGEYFRKRQDVNRDIRNKRAFAADLAKDLPDNFDADRWESYDLAAKYREIAAVKDQNNKIQRAKTFLSNYDNKLRALQAEKEEAIIAEERAINSRRRDLESSIERMKAEIAAAQNELRTLDDRLEDKKAVAESRYAEAATKLSADIDVAKTYVAKDVQDVIPMEREAEYADRMRKHLNEYRRMKQMQEELDCLAAESEEYTRKIELARTLPGVILRTATIPIEGFTVENGVPLIHGLPVSNLSEGEQLELCIDVALAKPSGLQMILIDGAEKLSDVNRERLYRKCKEKGVQFIATRTTNDAEMEVHYL